MSEKLVDVWPGSRLVTTRGLGRLAHYRILRHRPVINAGLEFIGPATPDGDETATATNDGERVTPRN
jgi:hypothetical protein